MMIKAYFLRLKLEDTIQVLQTLSAQFRPNRYSADEEDTGAKDKIIDDLKFRTFLAKNQYGFFLFGKRARYNIVLRPKDGFSNVIVDALGDLFSEEDVVSILKVLASGGTAFSFAANADEYYHRNRYTRTLGADQFEAWIGRDLRRYLPGVYWLTVISKKHANILAILTATLKPVVTQMDAAHWLVKLFDDPNEWQQHAARIDEWLVKQPSFFSKRRVLRQLDAAPHIGALSEAVSEWR